MIILSNKEKHQIGQPFTPNIETIAFALSHINRYTGHVGQYSVAQHCVLVAQQLPDHLKLAGLLHDAPEAYIGDVSAPLKKWLPDYQQIENFYHAVIDDHFKVETENPDIKIVDVRMLITEAKSFGILTEDFPQQVEPYKFDVTPLPPELAYVEFMEMFHELMEIRG